jgi:hypothetical protein
MDSDAETKCRIMPSVLTLIIRKKWFDMIVSGKKTEEYRELKRYWRHRLFTERLPHIEEGSLCHTFKKFDYVQFRNGYQNGSPTAIFKCIGIEIGKGKEEWGAIPGERYFIIKLGEKVLETWNLKTGEDSQGRAGTNRRKSKIRARCLLTREGGNHDNKK